MNASRTYASLCVTIAAGMLFAATGFAQINPVAATNATQAIKGKDSTLAYTPDPITTTSRPLSGKLFFSDAKRAQLDRARKEGVLVVEDEIVQRTDVLNGFVRRSDGSTTYWVNGGAQAGTRHLSDSARDVTATSAMVGTAPKFALAGSNEGAGQVEASPPPRGMVEQKKKAPRKNNPTAAKTKSPAK